jgi:hypothetical protein
MCTDRVAVAVEYHELTAEMLDRTRADDGQEAMAIAFDRLAVLATHAPTPPWSAGTSRT